MLANPHDIELDVLDDSAHNRLAAASARSTALRRYDMEYQSELRWWSGHSNGSEGVPRTAPADEVQPPRSPRRSPTEILTFQDS